MLNTIINQPWLLIALIFFGVLAFIAFIRRQDQRWIEKKIGEKNIVISSFGVIYLGASSDDGPIRRRNGFLVLAKDRLYFRSRRAGGIELEIHGDKVLEVYHDVRHRGEEAHQSLMMIDFINEKRRRDTAAFHVPYPPQWIQAVLTTLKKKELQ